ncbi:MAG: hypothetical protein HOI17_02545 [Alphaproteobacteria bacterium]|nr:hypothetical protein [Alphaproteobacteria bacterium]
MVQATLKDRIKEMRLRVLAEPSDQPLSQEADSLSGSKLDTDEPDTLTNSAKIKKSVLAQEPEAQEPKVQEPKVQEPEVQEPKVQELEIEESDHSRTVNQHNEDNSSSIEKTEENKSDFSKEQEPNEIIELTDKWVELEVRSRLSGLEQQEKQTRAMLKEIVEILDRIGSTQDNTQATVSEQTQPQPHTLSAISSNHSVIEKRPLTLSKIFQRVFVVLGTFLLLTGIIWGVLLYLFYNS